MKIAFIVGRAYFGATPSGGAETMAHSMLKHLASRGHQVTVYLVNVRGKSLILDGVTVRVCGTTEARTGAKQADVIMTHLSGTPLAQGLANRFSKPLVHIVHNTSEYMVGFLGQGTDLAIYNSQWVADHHDKLKSDPFIQYWEHKGQSTFRPRQAFDWKSVIVRPPVGISDYEVPFPPNEENFLDRHITLVNPVPNKGPHIFYELARRHPELKFMVVEGGYQPDDQIFEDLQNVYRHRHVQDMRQVYAETSIVLMPSWYESYGRVAVEAACSGIPSVVSSTPGLVEALGDAGSFVKPVKHGDLSTIDEWDLALKYILDDYDFCSKAARKRSRELGTQSQVELIAMEQAIKGLI